MHKRVTTSFIIYDAVGRSYYWEQRTRRTDDVGSFWGWFYIEFPLGRE